MKKIFLITVLVIVLLAGCDFLPDLRNKLRGQVSDAVTGVTTTAENVSDQVQKTKQSVEKKIEDVQNAAKEVNDAAKQLKEAADAVKKVGQ